MDTNSNIININIQIDNRRVITHRKKKVIWVCMTSTNQTKKGSLNYNSNSIKMGPICYNNPKSFPITFG